MPRKCRRRIRGKFNHLCFKPCAIPGVELAEVILEKDEIESIRLADLEGLYQEECAKEMGVSRPTFSRIIASARSKIADALINGKKIIIKE
ncbi:DUF134 domain-containing protein [Caminibacter mediatlanticus TB-2]|uniref:UPF0251 protein CMTB2_00719 n=1 Tax=Caminibacter mediatlanticus TB-2 TaxID=391592 RepID=A0AAI9AHR6_9BACT|nr:DUF134 domain-containing protein [Caminibacter mediatlanticus]EDM23745.1 predicted DNA-binding protein [Caminibacter mediatlanticus TB-2]QCT94641.1 DUF134 domain-containing protein [Caminibacter mediatlanticus TB-2]